MTLKKTLSGVIALTFLAVVAIPSTYAWSFFGLGNENKGVKNPAQAEQAFQRGVGRGGMMNPGAGAKLGGGMLGWQTNGGQAVSEAMQKLLAELKTAREAGDTEKVTALREQIQTAREAEVTARQTAMDGAIVGGYEAWKQYMEKQNAPAAMLQKITKDNFATFAALHAEQKKVRELNEKLGLKDEPGFGFGRGGCGR